MLNSNFAWDLLCLWIIPGLLNAALVLLSGWAVYYFFLGGSKK